MIGRRSPLPRVSVVIASYRWPEALALSLASALSQTVANIELLVVEDGPDRASREVVAAVADRRVRWLHLRRNSGSQAGPNSLGWRRARAPIVAYLGHDDLWHPEHLAGLLDALRSGADVAHAVTIVSGPPPDDWLMLAGGEAWQPSKFVPPSSIAHRRDSPRLAAWPAPAKTGWPVDYGLLLAAHARGSVVVASGTPTVFKFPAAWRLDVYETRDVSQQTALADRLRLNPSVGHELMTLALQHGAPSTLPAPRRGEPGEIADYARRMKGLPARFGARRTRWQASEEFHFPGWFPPELDEYGRAFRWTGLHARAVLRLDAPASTMLGVRIELAHWLEQAQVAELTVDLDGAPVALQQIEGTGAPLTLTGFTKRPTNRRFVEIGVTAPLICAGDARPGAIDDRCLGVAVYEIEVLE